MALTPQLSDALAGPDWLRSARSSAAARLADTPFPTTEQELWRYSRVADIDLGNYVTASPSTNASIDSDSETVAKLVGEAAAIVETVDGFITSLEIADEYASKGVIVAGPEGWDGNALGAVAEPVDIFGVLNAAFTVAPILIRVPRGVVVDKPIVVVNNVTTNRVATFPRTVIVAEEASEASVYELHTSSAEHALVLPVVEHHVEQAANLKYVNMQLLGSTVHHVGYNASRVEQDANFSSTTIALGGDYSRVRTDSFLNGKGGHSNLRAAYFGTDKQMHDFRTLQQHDAPKTTSDLFFKGAIGDSAQSVYSGLIRVAKGASGTNAFQTNRNLVLTQGAHAESVPNLEIEENDVKCSHASAIGPIDEEHRYYLESRGVPTAVANRLIAMGFLNEVIDGVPASGIRSMLVDRIGTRLDRIIGEAGE